jgi:inward rectifier potassium channel
MAYHDVPRYRAQQRNVSAITLPFRFAFRLPHHSALHRVTAPTPPDRTTAQPDATEREELGFGRTVAQQMRGRLVNRDGTSNGRKFGLGTQRLEHLYLGALAASWTSFLSWSLVLTMLVNGCFTLAFTALGPAAINGQDLVQTGDQFLTAFSFSMAVFTTSSTGPMYAVGSTAHWLVIVESLVGPLCLLVVAGLLIARLIRPRIRIRFSESAVVAPYEGGRGLMFRIVNTQPSELSDVQVIVNLGMFETVNGKRNREFYKLDLELDSVQFFNMHWTIVHPLDQNSPLRGFTPQMLHDAEVEVLITVNAHESTFSTRVMSRSSYYWDEVRWDAKFANIFMSATEGPIAIDVERLDRMDTLPEGTTSLPAASELTASAPRGGV